MKELEVEDPEEYRKMFRITPDMFHELEERLTPRLLRKTTNARIPLSPGEQLAIALKYVACGCDYQTLKQGFRFADNTISIAVGRVCQALVEEYKGETVRCPSTADEWRHLSQTFSDKWQFHNVLGALDGKHIRIRKPGKSGSLYYNYKGYFSMVLLALVDADYKFVWVEVGANGACSDAQLYNDCQLKRRLDGNNLGLPDSQNLPADDRPTPFFVIGDEAFALDIRMMKPYARRGLEHDERVFNYRLSRARRVVENAFGILANRFQCLFTSMRQNPATVSWIVLACICLHNMMRTRHPGEQPAMVDHYDANHNLVPGEWREGRQLDGLQHTRGNRASIVAKAQRDMLRDYYASPHGAVPWQERMLRPYPEAAPTAPPVVE
jgi:hypothetical protein